MEQGTTKAAKGHNKGGRPKKEVRCDQKLTVMCTLPERNLIEEKAAAVLLSVSEFLRNMALAGKIQRREKVLPKEVLALSATLNHIAANLDGIAKKRSGPDELNALERAELQFFSGQFRRLAKDIKNYMQ